MKPTAEFLQHHNVEPPRVDSKAFRQAWRVSSRLDRLAIEGAIEPVEWMAALAFRMVYHQAFGSIWPVRSLDLPATMRWNDRTTGLRLDALATMRKLRRELGAALGLVELCAINDCSWAALGRQLGVTPKTAREWTIDALKALSASGLLHGR